VTCFKLFRPTGYPLFTPQAQVLMPKVLTAPAVSGAKPKLDKRGELTRHEIPDGGLPGLYLIVQPSGKKSWAARYRHCGKARKLTIGPYPRIGLADARQSARKALVDASEGGDPAGDKRRRRQGGETSDVFKDVAERFITTYAMRNNKSWREIKRLINKEVLPAWGSRRLPQIHRRDVLSLLERIEQRGSPFTANRVFTVVRKLFNWAVQKALLSDSPCKGLEKPVTEISRDRILSDAELRWLWQACPDLGVTGGFVRMLMITGQRRTEVAGLSEAELVGRVWTIPASRTKNKRENRLELPAVAMQVLAEMPRIGAGAFYFTHDGTKPLSGFTLAKSNVDAAMLVKAKADGVTEIPAWTFHDIRRTVASNMARLSVTLTVAEAVLNHKSGTIQGVTAVYNRYDYAREKEQALATWANALGAIVTGQARGNVVALRG
jgi:integrase